MTSRDDRRIRVSAPPDGGRSTPPARRRPVVVEPESGGAGGGAGAKTTVAPAPATRRVVVPAPGAAGAGPPPSARRPPAREAPARPTAPPPRADERSGWRRFVPSRRVVGAVAAVLLLVVGGTLAYGYLQFRSIERIDLGDVLATGNGTNYLIVGSDTREGVDPNDPNAGAFLGDGAGAAGAERSDTILVLRVDGDGARMLSVPRDLYVTISETGQRSRINTAFNGGPRRLIATLRDQLGLPIHHYVQVDFVAFSSMVDALGGITIDFPHPAFDTHSGLNVTGTGPQELDGSQALAYVRSRFYTEVIDGREVPEGIGDIGRVQRQQRFLAALSAEMRSTYNPLALARVADTLADGMVIDSDLGFFRALDLMRRMQGLEPGENQLPTSNFRTSSGMSVLRLEAGADEILGRFGSAGATVT